MIINKKAADREPVKALHQPYLNVNSLPMDPLAKQTIFPRLCLSLSRLYLRNDPAWQPCHLRVIHGIGVYNAAADHLV